MCIEVIGLCAQELLSIRGSIVTTIGKEGWESYMIIQEARRKRILTLIMNKI